MGKPGGRGISRIRIRRASEKEMGPFGRRCRQSVNEIPPYKPCPVQSPPPSPTGPPVPDAPPTTELVARVRAGDPAAAAELVRAYEPVIRSRVRVWLRMQDPRLR